VKSKKRNHFFPIWLSPKTNSELHPIREFSFRTLNRYYRLATKDVLLVGASTGSEIANFYVFKNARVTLIEPLYSAFSELKTMVEFLGEGHRTRLHNVAVGSFRGNVHLYPADNNGESSSTLRPKAHLEINPEIKFGEPFMVPQLTLSDLLSPSAVPNFWILDTQGSELEVLRGGLEFLNEVDYLLIEVNRDENYEKCAKVEEIDQLLASYGFYRQLTRWWGTWGDAFYSRSYSFPTLRRLLRR
jgi:FkbM family methyltransferase